MPARLYTKETGMLRHCVPLACLVLAVLSPLQIELVRAGLPESEGDAEQDNYEVCWLNDPLGSRGSEAQMCCRPRPCGLSECWVPPSYTFEFCCDEPACRALYLEDIKRALDHAVALLPNENASVFAFRAAPEAFRAILRRGLHGMQLNVPGGLQSCNCALAYAVAALLWYKEEAADLAYRVQPRWFIDGINWRDVVAQGWGALFGWLARFDGRGESTIKPLTYEKSNVLDWINQKAGGTSHTSDVKTWDKATVAVWVEKHVSTDAARLLLRQDVDGEVLLSLSEADMLQLGMESFGARRKLILSVQSLRDPAPESKAVESQARLEDLADRQANLIAFLDTMQDEARAVAQLPDDWFRNEALSDPPFGAVAGKIRTAGIFSKVWMSIKHDLESRRKGHKCVVARGHENLGRWLNCERWDYNMSADFSSILPQLAGLDAGLRDGLGESSTSICVLGAPRSVVKTYESIRIKVIEVLSADAFVYVPFPDMLTPNLEEELKLLGRAVTAIVVPDVDKTTFEERTFNEFHDPRFPILYGRADGPWRAPLFKQMGSNMWGPHNQHCCRRMVESYEQQRGWRYEWVVFARADMFWGQQHPPLHVLHANFVHVPIGQDNNNYDGNEMPGLNDRHAVVPRQWFEAYFGRWDALIQGHAWQYLRAGADKYQINSEQYLLLHLRHMGVPILRFPPVSFLIHCTEGPQCQHLYKGTDLNKQRWTQTAKYITELIEARRTVMDDVHYIKRPEHGWIWSKQRTLHGWMWGALPKKSWYQPVREQEKWELLGADLACGLSKSGSISSLRWVFLQRCQCHA